MDINVTKEDLLAALRNIDSSPKIIKGRHSSTYDLVFNGQKYPPILVLSVANKLKGKNELTLEDFGNNVEIPFKILRDNGFEIIKKTKEMIPNIHDFIKVSEEQTTGQGTTDSAKIYSRENKISKEGLKTEISFGVGRASAIPWIAFIGYGQTVKNGIYPVYLYYKEFKKLVLAYGISESNSPIYKWKNLNNKQSIRNSFDEKIKNYGDSYVFKIYDSESLPSSQILESDLNQILNDYKFLFENKELITKPLKLNFKEDFNINQFQESLILSGLVYSNKLTIRFTASLLTKPFVILTGLSGSGKTKLAQSFVQWICEDKSQYEIVPVGADWTNREPLLGYPNALKPEEYVKPDNGVIDLILRANENPSLPYFLILDEMNLSHVERYFADFLSVMESNEAIPLFDKSLVVKNGVPPYLKVPTNLFIIGTVNIDETTNMFSPKVLDRANTIEFRINNDEMKGFLNSFKELNMKALYGNGTSSAQSFIELSQNKIFNSKESDSINTTLLKFFGELKKTGAEFGYRSASEILRLINQLEIIDNSLEINEKIDIAIMQKMLPKLHGSRRKLAPILEKLGGFCVKGEIKVLKDIFEKDEFDFQNESVLYPLSLEKITRMYKGAIDNGFASFAEA